MSDEQPRASLMRDLADADARHLLQVASKCFNHWAKTEFQVDVVTRGIARMIVDAEVRMRAAGVSERGIEIYSARCRRALKSELAKLACLEGDAERRRQAGQVN